MEDTLYAELKRKKMMLWKLAPWLIISSVYVLLMIANPTPKAGLVVSLSTFIGFFISMLALFISFALPDDWAEKAHSVILNFIFIFCTMYLFTFVYWIIAYVDKGPFF